MALARMTNQMTRVPHDEMVDVFSRALEARSVAPDRAHKIAVILADSTCDGVP